MCFGNNEWVNGFARPSAAIVPPIGKEAAVEQLGQNVETMEHGTKATHNGPPIQDEINAGKDRGRGASLSKEKHFRNNRFPYVNQFKNNRMAHANYKLDYVDGNEKLKFVLEQIDSVEKAFGFCRGRKTA